MLISSYTSILPSWTEAFTSGNAPRALAVTAIKVSFTVGLYPVFLFPIFSGKIPNPQEIRNVHRHMIFSPRSISPAFQHAVRDGFPNAREGKSLPNLALDTLPGFSFSYRLKASKHLPW